MKCEIKLSADCISSLRSKMQQERTTIERRIISRLSYIGKECVTLARKGGMYANRTGNLRSSIGYLVLNNGDVCTADGGRPYTGTHATGTDGVKCAKNLIEELKVRYSNKGIVLCLFAGMNYAVYVESVHHLDVLTSAQLLLQQLVKEELS